MARASGRCSTKRSLRRSPSPCGGPTPPTGSARVEEAAIEDDGRGDAPPKETRGDAGPSTGLAGAIGAALAPGAVERIAFGARAADARRLLRAGLGGTGWSEFERARAATARQFDAQLSALETPDRRAPARLVQPFALMREARASAQDLGLSNPCYADAGALAAWIAERIARRRPTAWIRLDALARAFAPPAIAYAALSRIDRAAAWRRWRGATLTAPIDTGWIEAAAASVAEGIGAADALGAPNAPEAAMLARRPGDAGWRGAAAAAEAIAALGPEALSRRALTSDGADLDLERWDLWAHALAPARAVVLVGPVDLSAALARRFGIEVAAHMPFPASAAQRRALGLSAAEIEAPEALAAVEARLDAIGPRLAETPVLIAAGPFAGRIAARAKALGGIALDVGDAASVWAGWAPSDRGDGGFRADPAAAPIEGAPFSDRFEPKRIGGASCRRERGGARNLAGRFDRLLGDPGAIPETAAPLALLSASEAPLRPAIRALQRGGIDLGRENLGRESLGPHGVASWRRAARDLSDLDGQAAPEFFTFDHVAAAVADPRTALPDILLSNCDARVFAYRRFHIARETGVDVGQRRDPLQRAALCLTLWMEMIDRRGPVATIRAEEAIADAAASADAFEAIVDGFDARLAEATRAGAIPLEAAADALGDALDRSVAAGASEEADERAGPRLWIDPEEVAALSAPARVRALPS
ncbi:MAG: hypothetical protein AAFW46_15880, partial [Pseudomonadota bacterium]